MRRIERLLPMLYVLGGAFVWAGFRAAPPDGLANAGIALYVFPITVATRFFGLGFPPFAPADLGYYGRHTAFFVPSVLVMALAIHVVARWAKSLRRK